MYWSFLRGKESHKSERVSSCVTCINFWICSRFRHPDVCNVSNLNPNALHLPPTSRSFLGCWRWRRGGRGPFLINEVAQKHSTLNSFGGLENVEKCSLCLPIKQAEVASCWLAQAIAPPVLSHAVEIKASSSQSTTYSSSRWWSIHVNPWIHTVYTYRQGAICNSQVSWWRAALQITQREAERAISIVQNQQ